MSKWQWAQLIGFQALWLLAVMGQNATVWLLGLLLLGQFIFTPSRSQDLRVLALAGIGVVMDALLTWSGVFEFSQSPWWLLLLWLGFVLTLGHSMRWLSGVHWPWLMLMGAVSGPCSYIAGWRLDAVSLPLGVLPTLWILVPLWALLLPVLVRADKHLRKGVTPLC